MQHRLQHRNQMPFTDGLRAPHHLPLRHRVDGVEVIYPRLAVVLPLMHGVHPQIPRLSFRLRLATFPDRYLT